MSFVPGTLYVSYYALSLLVGNVLSYICYGKQQWKNCWNGRALFYVFPSSATLATVEVSRTNDHKIALLTIAFYSYVDTGRVFLIANRF